MSPRGRAVTVRGRRENTALGAAGGRPSAAALPAGRRKAAWTRGSGLRRTHADNFAVRMASLRMTRPEDTALSPGERSDAMRRGLASFRAILVLTACAGGLILGCRIARSVSETRRIRQIRLRLDEIGRAIERYHSPGCIHEGPAVLIPPTEQRARFHIADGRRWDLAELKHSVTVRGAELAGCRWPGADLRGVRFIDCDFSGADLRGALLDGAQLVRCRFDGANLAAATLVLAQVRDSSFHRADLSCADLRAADLSGSSLFMLILRRSSDDHRAKLVGARYDHRTRWPLTLVAPATEGAILVK